MNLKRIISRYFTTTFILIGTVSCMTGSRINSAYKNNRNGVNIRQAKSNEKRQASDTASIMPDMVKFKDKDGKEMTVLNSVLDTVTGDYELAVSLNEVTIVSKASIVPERGGIITLPFVITIPGDFIQKDWRLTVTPTLDNDGRKTVLKPIVITGRKFQEMEDRERMYKENSLSRKARKEGRMAQRMVAFGLTDDSSKEDRQKYEDWKKALSDIEAGRMLDSIIPAGKALEYHYRQDFKTEDFSRRLQLTIAAKIEDLGASTFMLRESDTLTYILSTLTQFLDRQTRYIREKIMRKVTETLKAEITYPVAGTEVIDTLGHNAGELAKVRNKIQEINNSYQFVIDSISITAGASPEGSAAQNKYLSEQRGERLKDILQNMLDDDLEVQAIKVHSVGEDWISLRNIITGSGLHHKDDILAIIDQTEDQDERESKIMALSPDEYKFMRDSLYPQLRTVEFVFYLARRGMVEDFMYTDVVDEEYAHALELMDEHRYAQAMPKMLEYRDINAAVCYMSLGYDKEALDILQEEKSSAEVEYLKAVLLSRQGNTQAAVDAFITSVRFDPSKMNRGQLDPEISKLIQAYRLDEMDF